MPGGAAKPKKEAPKKELDREMEAPTSEVVAVDLTDDSSGPVPDGAFEMPKATGSGAGASAEGEARQEVEGEGAGPALPADTSKDMEVMDTDDASIQSDNHDTSKARGSSSCDSASSTPKVAGGPPKETELQAATSSPAPRPDEAVHKLAKALVAPTNKAGGGESAEAPSGTANAARVVLQLVTAASSPDAAAAGPTGELLGKAVSRCARKAAQPVPFSLSQVVTGDELSSAELPQAWQGDVATIPAGGCAHHPMSSMLEIVMKGGKPASDLLASMHRGLSDACRHHRGAAGDGRKAEADSSAAVGVHVLCHAAVLAARHPQDLEPSGEAASAFAVYAGIVEVLGASTEGGAAAELVSDIRRCCTVDIYLGAHVALLALRHLPQVAVGNADVLETFLFMADPKLVMFGSIWQAAGPAPDRAETDATTSAEHAAAMVQASLQWDWFSQNATWRLLAAEMPHQDCSALELLLQRLLPVMDPGEHFEAVSGALALLCRAFPTRGLLCLVEALNAGYHLLASAVFAHWQRVLHYLCDNAIQPDPFVQVSILPFSFAGVPRD
eukprot:gene3238-4083_t